MSIELITYYKSEYRFLPASIFSYDASDEIINYHPKKINSQSGKIALLHEISHAKLSHFHYLLDIELLLMELAAWRYTYKLAKKHNIPVSSNYIDSCIQSYDNWVMERGSCPVCNNFCLQESIEIFSCFMCGTRWQVDSDLQSKIVKRVITKIQ